MQAYSNPEREDDSHALPDIEVFYSPYIICECCGFIDLDRDTDEPCSICNSALLSRDRIGVGFFWWPRFPGCLPDSDPIGPFDTEAEALQDAQDVY